MEAARFYLDYLKRTRRCNITVAQLAAEALEAEQKDGFGALYLADLRKRLNRFAPDFGTRPIAAITVEELDDWLRNLECAPKTRANFRANIGVLFSYAEPVELIDANPVKRTSAPKLIDKAAEIFQSSLADRLSVTPPGAADVIRKLRKLKVLEQTQNAVRHKSAARFRWLL